ncbi:hypothetical protein Adu01nite_16340 [Paractinoplanes durhamensis]|uniref:Uncharacterized protein n=1 Tax=Paractinoplanes durhamensis TaxID=113563 RepID=A0ABQ3YSC8_9ACTN|nr:hypothetical protein Adu01nite_16340 [Actinoplanes durhamensis]
MIEKAEREIGRESEAEQHEQANHTPGHPGRTVLSARHSIQHPHGNTPSRHIDTSWDRCWWMSVLAGSAVLEVRLLGPVEPWAGRRQLPIGEPRQRAVILALTWGRSGIDRHADPAGRPGEHVAGR